VQVCYFVAILVYSENARFKTTADLHKILLKLKKKCYENFWNTESSFWRAENRKKSLSVVFQVQQRHTSVKDTKCLVFPTTRKPDKNVDQVMGIVLKNRRTTIHETGQEFHMGHFRAFLKIIWTCHQICAWQW